tara:strand:- start:116 stop:433 length:318 start_codon:yes stop_codon:yes gene_type:complete
MATDLSAVVLPYVKRLTLSGTPDNLSEVNLPEAATKLSLQFISADGKAAWAGTDGAAIGSDYGTIAADGWFEVPLRGRNRCARSAVFLASGTASTVVEIWLDEDN